VTTYRPATIDDAAAIADLHARSWRATYRGAYSDAYLDGPVAEERLATWTARLEDPLPNQFVVVAEDDGAVVGFACAYGAEDEQLGSFLDNIHTDPARHNQGIGTGLFSAIVDWCRTHHAVHGLHLKVLDRNHNARRFYERRGGIEQGTVPASNPWVMQGTSVLMVAWPTLDSVLHSRD
jgi:GNAT superfamily N-acetyltransferase